MDSTEIQATLSGATIEVCYQPIVSLADRQPMGLEALVRFNHPVRGLLQPLEFVPQIEDAGMASKLTDLVGSRALSDIGAIQRAMPDGITLDISVNMPLDVLLVPDTFHRFDRAREQAGVAPERIVVELTESRPVDDLRALSLALDQFRAAGYRTAIDDFTPAMANHDALLDLPFSLLKFDHALTADAMQPGPAHEFVLATIGAARARNLCVVAEGVTNAAIWAMLADWSVDAAQGFWIGHPMLAGEVANWCVAWLATPSPPP